MVRMATSLRNMKSWRIATYLWQGRKADAVAAILLFISGVPVQFTKRSVERMGKASDMNTRHFSGEEKGIFSTDNAWDGGTSYKAGGTDEMCMSRKGGAPCVSPFTNGKGLGIADD